MGAAIFWVRAAAILVAVAVAEPTPKQWALEMFVELTAVTGDLLQVELRRHCCHSAEEATTQFCNEFEIPPHDCERLQRYVVNTSGHFAGCDCSNGGKTLSVDQVSKKLDTASINVFRTDLNRTHSIKLAIHDGDFAVLDARVDELCQKLELDDSACSSLSDMMRARSRDLEMKLHRRTLLRYAQNADVVDQVISSIESMMDGLKRQIGDIKDEVQERALAYRKLKLRSQVEIHALERRIRELETNAFERQPVLVNSKITIDKTSSTTSHKAFVPESLRIPRVHASNFSYAQYLEFANKSTPVIIQGLSDFPGSPGLPVWTIESLTSACGDALVTLKRRASESVATATPGGDGLSAWAGVKPVTKATLRHFLRDFASDGPTMPWPFGYADLYLHDASIREFCPILLSDVTIPRYFVDDRLQHLTRSKQTSYWPSLFIGDKHTSSALHADWASTAAWMGLLKGKKRWAIAKPSAAAALNSLIPTVKSPSHGRFNATLLGSTISPLLKPGELYEDDLMAGEVLFIPAGSPHQVQNLEKTIAVAANYVDTVNYEAFREHVLGEKYSTTGQTYKAHTQLLRELDGFGTSTKLGDICGEPVDLTFSEFKERYTRHEETAV